MARVMIRAIFGVDMKLYEEFSWLWSEVTPVGTYIDEAQDLCEIVRDALGYMPQNILELGAGGGYLLHDLQTLYPSINITLIDSSTQMIAEAKRRNPNVKTICADMTNVNLTERFDLVLLHDAVMYLEDKFAVSKVLNIMRTHTAEGGVGVIVPDVCKETFEERILTAEADGPRARVHVTEWHWASEPQSDTVWVDFSVLIREHGQHVVQSHHETHRMLVLSLSDWMTLFLNNRWIQDFPNMPWIHGGELFLLRPTISN